MLNVHSFELCAKNLASKPPLVAREIHVWVARIDVPYPACAHTLSSAERARAERFRSDVTRTQFIVRRAALRNVLSAYTGVSPASIAYNENEYGKPVLA